MQAKDVRDRCGASYDCQVSLVEVLERLQPRLTSHFPLDRLRRVRSLLHCDLRHAREWLALSVDRQSQIANDVEVGKVRDRKIRTDLDSAASVRLGSCAFCNCSP